MPSNAPIPPEADAVFEGGGVKGIALAGAVAAAEDAGIKEWKNVAGTSAGAIVACLLVVGYNGRKLKEILEPIKYREFTDYGWGGLARGLVNSLWQRGLAPGRFFSDWLATQIKQSPLAEERQKELLTFGDVVRTDLPTTLTADQARRARYRLRVVASDITSGRMLVLPDDIEYFKKGKDGPPYEKDTLTLAEAVRMSMSYPYLYSPVRLFDKRDSRCHYVVDGGLLSNFPVWLFDSGDERTPARPTWGFRLHGGSAPNEELPYRDIPLPFWRLKLAKAMFQSATEAWDREQLGRATSARTVSVPTRAIGTTDFGLTPEQADQLYTWGVEKASEFFASAETRAYVQNFEDRQRSGTNA